MEEIFIQLGLLIIVAAIFGLLAKLFRQPLILFYLLAGVALGPIFKLITNSETIDLLSEIGIAFLLFVVGIEMSLKTFRSIAFVSILGGFLKSIIVLGLGYVIAILLGFEHIEALFVGIVLSFSSTAVVLKLLDDRDELATLHGKLIIGILLFEDFMAVLILIMVNSLGAFSVASMVGTLFKGLLLVLCFYLISKFIFPKLFKFAAKSPELLYILSLAVCFSGAVIFHLFGLSIAIGAFFAGISLADLKYKYEIVGRVRSVRDFFVTIFFISLGLELYLGNILKYIWPMVILCLFVVIIKPIIIVVVTSLFGFKKKTTFLTAISLGQISEFSLIIAFAGRNMGILTHEFISLSIGILMITTTVTVYAIKYEKKLLKLFSKPLSIFEKLGKGKKENFYLPDKHSPEIMLCGSDRMGHYILKSTKKYHRDVVVVDYNPEVINDLSKNKIPSIYGDVTDDEIYDLISTKKLKYVIITFPSLGDNLYVINKIKSLNPKIKVIATGVDAEEADDLYDAGANYVITPYYISGKYFAKVLTEIFENSEKLPKLQKLHLKELKEIEL